MGISIQQFLSYLLDDTKPQGSFRDQAGANRSMRRHSVVSERATLLFLLALTCAVSSSLERSSLLILPSSSSCLAKLQLGVLCCFLPSLAIHIPTRPDISPPLQNAFCWSSSTGFGVIGTQHYSSIYKGSISMIVLMQSYRRMNNGQRWFLCPQMPEGDC